MSSDSLTAADIRLTAEARAAAADLALRAALDLVEAGRADLFREAVSRHRNASALGRVFARVDRETGR